MTLLFLAPAFSKLGLPCRTAARGAHHVHTHNATVYIPMHHNTDKGVLQVFYTTCRVLSQPVRVSA